MIDSSPIVQEDCRRVVAARRATFEQLRDAHVFLTGGTGFVGIWLLRTLAHAADTLELNLRATVLTRDPVSFRRRYPELASHPAIELFAGDVRSFVLPQRPLSHIVHAAAETNVTLAHPPPQQYVDVSLGGTLRVATLARATQTRRMLFISSGAVYGSGAFAHAPAHEDAVEAPPTTDPQAAYGNAKRASEAVCAALAFDGPAVAIARLFAFVGPDLPLSSGYAVGNFLRDALRRETIRITGDGTPLRSYMYAADLALWLWTILVEGESCRPYNVGSEYGVSIADLARAVVDAAMVPADITIARAAHVGARPNRYVPSTQRARVELGLSEGISLHEAIARTAAWCREDDTRYLN